MVAYAPFDKPLVTLRYKSKGRTVTVRAVRRDAIEVVVGHGHGGRVVRDRDELASNYEQ